VASYSSQAHLFLLFLKKIICTKELYFRYICTTNNKERKKERKMERKKERKMERKKERKMERKK